MALRPLVPETSASANSATSALFGCFKYGLEKILIQLISILGWFPNTIR